MFALVLESVILRSDAKFSLFLHIVIITALYCNGIFMSNHFHFAEPMRSTEHHSEKVDVM
jgi:hypothetical protein